MVLLTPNAFKSKLEEKKRDHGGRHFIEMFDTLTVELFISKSLKKEKQEEIFSQAQ